MNKIRQTGIAWIEKYYQLLFFIIITFLAIWIRFEGRETISGDMYSCLVPWFDEIKDMGGIRALSEQVGNYNLLYQTIISLMTYIPMDAMYLYKIFSCIFDFALALSAAYIICKWSQKEDKTSLFQMVYTCVLFLPTVVLNSAYWGQCDSIYVLFLIWTVYFLIERRYRLAFVFLGIAFAFKFQSVFILPIIVMLYFYRKDFSILNIGYSVLTFWLSGIVAYTQGRSIMEPFHIYATQAGYYEQMYMNYPSFWLLVGNDYTYMKSLAMLTTLVLLGIGMYLVLEKKVVLDEASDVLMLLCQSAWTMLLFLPEMHERYSYFVDILLVLLCFHCQKKSLILIAVTEVMLSLVTYGYYLFHNGSISMIHGVINLILWTVFSGSMLYSSDCRDALLKE